MPQGGVLHAEQRIEMPKPTAKSNTHSYIWRKRWVDENIVLRSQRANKVPHLTWRLL